MAFDQGRAMHPEQSPVGSGGSGDAQDQSGIVCDQCRARKIKCDKQVPCSNCRASKKTCTASSRPKEPRSRILVSAQYEKKIDDMESKLSAMESHLKALTSTITSLVSQGARLSLPDTEREHQHAAISPKPIKSNRSSYGTESGLNAQTAFASQFLEQAVRGMSMEEASPGVEKALGNLNHLVHLQKSQPASDWTSFALQRAIPAGGLSKLPMPPLDVAMQHLSEIDESFCSIFSILCATVGIVDFASICRRVYSTTNDVPDALFIIANAGLYNLFMERHAVLTDEAAREECHTYMVLCRTNLETSLADMKLFLHPDLENIQALTFSSMYFLDISKPYMAWHLVSAAANLCQTAGYHRLETLREDSPAVSQIKSIVFWQVYTLDKGIGLRLNRSSVIRDQDISIPRHLDFSGFRLLQDDNYPDLWVYLAELQGQIYDQLYCPAALREPQINQVARAKGLAQKCQELQVFSAQFDDLEEEADTWSPFLEVFAVGDKVQLYVTMTLAYRIIPAPDGFESRFCNECLVAARLATTTYCEGFDAIKLGPYAKTLYVHWNLMLTPFAPFFVLLCHVIETASPEDIAIIKSFVACLEAARSVSETVETLYRLYQAMLDVALLYLDAKTPANDQETIGIGDEFELYLRQLGYLPSDGQMMQGASLMDIPDMFSWGQAPEAGRFSDA